MHPRLARIRRAIDAVSYGKVRPMQALSAGDVDDSAVRRRNRDRADRLRILILKDGNPGATGVGGLPYTAIYLANIKDVRFIRHSSCSPSAAATKRTDHPPAHVGHETRSLSSDVSSRKQARKEKACCDVE